MFLTILLLAVFFSFNMGGASFAASFAAPYGSKLIGKHKAGLLFVLFVILGAVLLGENVSITLGRELIDPSLISPPAIVIIFLTGGLSMFVSNIMKIPQSTSLVAVAAIAGVGAHYGRLELNTLYYLIPFWIVLPFLSYILTYGLVGYIYPPRKTNFWIYERFVNHQNKLKNFVIIMSCYNAFAIGTNNVANIAGPLIGLSDTFALRDVLIVFALLYGAGAFIFTGPIKTASHKIVPLGLLTASIISLVSGTLMIIASAFGVPQSFVMLNMGAIFAVASLKEGHSLTFSKPLTKSILYTWTINPLITFFMSWGLSYAFLQ